MWASRDGILRAVEKDIYDDLQDGLENCVNIYIRTIERLVREKSWNAFVHPVNPVLNETRVRQLYKYSCL
jgi:hypothetical protein